MMLAVVANSGDLGDPSVAAAAAEIALHCVCPWAVDLRLQCQAIMQMQGLQYARGWSSKPTLQRTPKTTWAAAAPTTSASPFALLAAPQRVSKHILWSSLPCNEFPLYDTLFFILYVFSYGPGDKS